ncbi:MAG: glycosyltransferase [Candidatus Brocadiia bacterium]
MKILVVTNMFPVPDRPAFGIFIKEQVESLRRLGAEVDVLFIEGYRSKLNYIKAIFELRRRISRTKYDLVHAHYGLSGWVARLQCAVPVVVSFHGDDLLGTPVQITDSKSQIPNFRYSFTSRVLAGLNKIMARLSSAIIVQSDAMWRKSGLASAQVIPCGVDLNVFRPIDRAKARQTLGWDSARKYILFPSDPVIPVKNFGLAEAAFKLAKSAIPEAELVTLAKAEPRERIALYMNAADALVFTSVHEGAGLVVKEAMACNLPIVSVDVGDVRDVIQGATNCYITPRQPQAMANRLTDILKNSQRSNGRERAERFELNHIAGRILELYSGINKTPAISQPVTVAGARTGGRVLMLVHSYYPYDPRVRREAEALSDRGTGVDIVCLRNQDELLLETVNGINVYRLPVSRHRGSGLVTYLTEYLSFFLLALWQSTKLFIRNRYQVIQVHTIPDWLVFSALIPRFLGAKIILDMHEVMPEFFSYRYDLSAGHPVIRLMRLSERMSTAFASRVITVSDGLKDILVARGVPANRITVVMNSADDRLFKSEISRRGKAQRDTKPEFVLAYHGLLSDIYDLSVVFRALKKLKARIPGIKFLVIGHGPQEPEYRALVDSLGLGQAVDFLGHHSQEQVVGLLAGVDAGIVPLNGSEFTHLAFPTKLVEYVALGIPAITAERRTVAHYFGNSGVSFYKPDDEASLAEAIWALYQQPDKGQSQARRALESYSRISWGVMKSRYYNLVDGLNGR